MIDISWFEWYDWYLALRARILRTRDGSLSSEIWVSICEKRQDVSSTETKKDQIGKRKRAQRLQSKHHERKISIVIRRCGWFRRRGWGCTTLNLWILRTLGLLLFRWFVGERSEQGPRSSDCTRLWGWLWRFGTFLWRQIRILSFRLSLSSINRWQFLICLGALTCFLGHRALIRIYLRTVFDSRSFSTPLT